MNRPKKIFIVDDDPGILMMLRLLLELEGYEAVVCEEAQAVLGKLDHERPDLVLLDAMMPVLNGLEILKLIQAKKCLHQPPVILFTGSTDPTYRKDALQAGARDVVSKPFVKEELLARIESLLCAGA
jgi:DNA-binding response OmpR family regulator